MINASVAKLNQYIGDTVFDRVMEEIDAAQEEGLSYFEVDVHNLDMNLKLDIVLALNEMGYEVELNDDAMILEVQYDE